MPSRTHPLHLELSTPIKIRKTYFCNVFANCNPTNNIGLPNSESTQEGFNRVYQKKGLKEYSLTVRARKICENFQLAQ